MRRSGWLILSLFFYVPLLSGQSLRVDPQLFFLDDKVIEVTLTTDIKKLRIEKKTPVWQPADVKMRFSDSSVIKEQIRVRPRGIFRKNNCDIASLMLDFKTPAAPKLSLLKKLKLVGGCRSGSHYEALLLKEYVVYKIYNFISPMSFRVRLLHINYTDSKNKNKPYAQYAFLIEDIKDLTRRNNCVEKIDNDLQTEASNRQHMNLVSLFQFMIGNTDWSVPKAHNIKLMVPKNDTFARPYVIAYDFDFAGFVNAGYATPNEELDIKSVTQRLYRGFGRNMHELQINLDIFKQKKEQIMFYLQNFELLDASDKKELVKYLQEFYKIINNKKLCKAIFIDNARRN